MNHLRLFVAMTDENIVGREILNALGKREVSVDGVIIEKSSHAEKEKEYLRNDDYNPPSFRELLIRYRIVATEVPDLNSEKTVDMLKIFRPDLLLLDGSKIIKRPVFEAVRFGALNAHPGLLPEYRGVDSVRWAIYHGDPVGATCHFVDTGLDTGPILLRREVVIQRGESLLSLRVRVMRVCAELMVESVLGLNNETLRPIPQQKDQGRYFSWAPPEVREAVDHKLASTI